MTDTVAMEIAKSALIITLEIAMPVLLFSLVAGLVVSILQAVTQIQEFTMTFIPKVLATMLALALFGPWMLHKIVDFTSNLLINLPSFLK